MSSNSVELEGTGSWCALRAVRSGTVEGQETAHAIAVTGRKLTGDALMEVHQSGLGVLLEQVLNTSRPGGLSHVLGGNHEGIHHTGGIRVALRGDVLLGVRINLATIDDLGDITRTIRDDTELLERAQKSVALNVSVFHNLADSGGPDLKEVLVLWRETLESIVQNVWRDSHSCLLSVFSRTSLQRIGWRRFSGHPGERLFYRKEPSQPFRLFWLPVLPQ